MLKRKERWRLEDCCDCWHYNNPLTADWSGLLATVSSCLRLLFVFYNQPRQFCSDMMNDELVLISVNYCWTWVVHRVCSVVAVVSDYLVCASLVDVWLAVDCSRCGDWRSCACCFHWWLICIKHLCVSVLRLWHTVCSHCSMVVNLIEVDSLSCCHGMSVRCLAGCGYI